MTKVDTYTRETTVGKCRKVTDQESEPLIKWARRTMEGYLALRVVLAGEARVDVIEGEVRVGLPWRVH